MVRPTAGVQNSDGRSERR